MAYDETATHRRQTPTKPTPLRPPRGRWIRPSAKCSSRTAAHCAEWPGCPPNSPTSPRSSTANCASSAWCSSACGPRAPPRRPPRASPNWRRSRETAGSEVLEGLVQRRDRPDASTYLGSGKADELREVVLETGADTVICDGELTPAQLTALEKVVKVKVIDRTALILDIFAQHATSREGKAQVALAQMEYMLPRLRGWGESMSRQAGGRAGSNGGVGLRGPGETKIETDRRRIRERMAKLRREIKGMKAARDTKRTRRLSSGIPSVAIVGYTNAGKSSLLNAITGSGVLVQDALFATLDPTTRRAATRRRSRDRAHRHGRVRAAPADPVGRGVPLDARGGHRRGSAAARRRRVRPVPDRADQGRA